jgi:ATP-dependent exoDNAse (exonuclease V) beta subunit
MSKTWTPEQTQAIEWRDRDVCVVAGAGSGKTGVLVERFLRIVKDSLAGKLPPEQCAGVGEILVITFTNKATREMKERIVRELLAEGLHEQRRQVETAYISTIHGFCARLLKENPFEAGVDPAFRVVEGAEARRILRNAFESVIERAYAEEETDITELVAAMQDERVFGTDADDPLEALYRSLEAALHKLRGAGIWLEEAHAHWQSGQDITAARSLLPMMDLLNPLLQEIHACLESLKTLRAGLGSALELQRRALVERAEAFVPLSEASSRARVAEATQAIQEISKQVSTLKRPRTNAPAEESAIRDIFQRIHLAAQNAKAFYDLLAEREEQAEQQCHRFWGLLVATWAAYTEMKREQGLLDNDDLQSQAVQLLETFPGTRQRYQRRFRHILVDEFQDTNPLQMRLIDLLHIRPHALATPPQAPANRLFIVGDTQQSIYLFRNADPSIFQRMEHAYRTNGLGEHIQLAGNFRSRSEILKLINYLFGQVWRGAEHSFMPLESRARFAEKPQPSIEVVVAWEEKRKNEVDAEADALARRIRQMVESRQITITDTAHPRFGEPVGYRDIAVLLRALTHIESFERAFTRQKVPCFVVGGGRGYYARYEVRDVMNILTVLDNPLDDVALAATLRSPMVGLDVDTLYALALYASTAANGKREFLYPAIPGFLQAALIAPEEAERLRHFYHLMERLRAEEDRLPVGQLLERIVEATQYDARLLVRPNGKRRLANVRKLLQMANAHSVHGVSDFIRSLREIEKLSDREGDAPLEDEAANVVRLITIHKAKGLEFPVVIVAQMDRKLDQPERNLFLCDPHGPAIGCKIGDYKSAAYRAIEERRREASRAEEMRILYVALTRAREHLVLSGTVAGKPRSFNWADTVFEHLALTDVPTAPETRTVADIEYRILPRNTLLSG